ncbi:unnamed protein product [Pleuronectes platessa]|uniref:Uncharacterized protein n=1 Tax=Pleuronectes platessa TaxID=8262 RepID=A0A9N7V9K5_PLEPL|nr:unnamed protein product [Pleuronectes platessa]
MLPSHKILIIFYFLFTLQCTVGDEKYKILLFVNVDLCDVSFRQIGSFFTRKTFNHKSLTEKVMDDIYRPTKHLNPSMSGFTPRSTQEEESGKN